MALNPARGTEPAAGRAGWWRLAVLALRELQAGQSGFALLVACLALGVAVITGVGALSDAMRAGFERQGEALLGGDATIARPHQRADKAEREWMQARGRVSEAATLRAMARRIDGTEQVLVELKAVDTLYPLAGKLLLDGGASTQSVLHAGTGAAIDRLLLERLGIRIGDRISIGRAEVEVRTIIEFEPDKITERLTFGPRVLVSVPTLLATGLAEPGSLVRWRYALKLTSPADDTGLAAFRDEVKAVWPDAGFTVTDRRDPSPQVSRTLERLRQFLTLIGLTSLLVGGVGVANAVSAYIDRRRKVIATLKSLGASWGEIVFLHLVQVLTIAGLGIAIGIAVGLLLPGLVTNLLGDALPIRGELGVSARSLGIAVAYGFLVALLYALWPLGRAGEVRAAELFREEVAAERRWPRIGVMIAVALVAAALIALAVLTSEAKRLALYFCLGLAGVLAAFYLLGLLIELLARRLPRTGRPEVKLALGNLGAPDGMTRSTVLSLGSGLSLLVAVALVDSSIVHEIRGRLPKASPSFFLLDIPRGEIDDLAGLVRRLEPRAGIVQAPMLRGRIVRLAGRPVEEIRARPEASWVLRGDRGLTYADEVPEGSRVVEGKWWTKDYTGEPLVSFEADIARLLGLKLGDTVTVNVLGRNLTARIANLREVRWESLAINFVVVFNPAALSGAPHNLLATATLPGDVPVAREAALAREIARAHPSVTAIRVKDAINAFGVIFGRIMQAVRAAGSVTLLAGALVLAGALATAQRRRIRQAVIVKTLGGTRRQIMLAHALEYTLLASATAAIASAVGAVTAWVVLHRVMDVPLVLSPGVIAQAVSIALALVLLFGGIGTWRVLRARSVPYLRNE